MWYLDTYTLPSHPSKHSPASTYKFCIDLRENVENDLGWSLPSFRHLSLNRAWPLRQGFQNRPRRAHMKWAMTHPNVCGNPSCGVPRPPFSDPASKLWYGFQEASRCFKCYDYRWKFHRENPRKRLNHERYLETHEDACGNCGALRQGKAANEFRGFAENARCGACYRHKVHHGFDTERPLSPKAEHEEWLKIPGNEDVCGNCGVARDCNFRGFCEKARCSKCRKYNSAHDAERPASMWKPGKKDHEEWLKTPGNRDVCGNCGIARYARFNGYCEEARCHNCYTYRNNKGVERPAHLWKPTMSGQRPTKSDHKRWLETPGNRDVCSNCGIDRDADFRGFCEEARCQNCYRYFLKKGVERPTMV